MGRTLPAISYSILPYQWNPTTEHRFAYGYVLDALLASESHYRLKSGAWSGGGPFYAHHKSIKADGELRLRVLRQGVNFGEYVIQQGSVLGSDPHPTVGAIPSFADITADMPGDYASAYKRTRPGNPVAGLAQFIRELRDLPTVPFRKVLRGPRRRIPRLALPGTFGSGNTRSLYRPIESYPIQSWPRFLKRQLSDFRNLGSEYLNVVFGWKPFVNDLRKMYNLWYDIDKRMAQIIRENGKGIRRKATIKDDRRVVSQTSTLSAFPFVNCLGSPGITTGGSFTYHTKIVTQTERRWYVGKYQYYIPDVSSSQWNARARLALFGALPTPELLWEALPWSWLIDWFSNMGDIMSNASVNAVDNLTTKYSFTMKHVKDETTYTTHVYTPKVDIPPLFKWLGVDHSFHSSQIVESKARIGGGNPFGLNVKFETLTPYQIGILGALGLSRGLVK